MRGITRPVALETPETTEERKSKADALVWLGGNFVDKTYRVESRSIVLLFSVRANGTGQSELLPG